MSFFLISNNGILFSFNQPKSHIMETSKQTNKQTLKSVIYGVAAMLLVSCSKEELLIPILENQKDTSELSFSPDQLKRIQLNQKAAELMATIVQNPVK